jgi:hypothetical protein
MTRPPRCVLYSKCPTCSRTQHTYHWPGLLLQKLSLPEGCLIKPEVITTRSLPLQTQMPHVFHSRAYCRPGLLLQELPEGCCPNPNVLRGGGMQREMCTQTLLPVPAAAGPGAALEPHADAVRRPVARAATALPVCHARQGGALRPLRCGSLSCCCWW